jgi:hypothetical protein
MTPMKATINGVTVEGTVDEIIEYQRKMSITKTDFGDKLTPKIPWVVGDPPYTTSTSF